jgi:glycosyltransferase involved in cell wall biosynthesis
MSEPRMQNPGSAPEFSIVIPCFNEGDALPVTIPPLIEELSKQGRSYELVLVDNGSQDDTKAIIDGFITQGLPIRRADVARNEGYGLGVITGMKAARGNIVVMGAADGQIANADIVDRKSVV